MTHADADRGRAGADRPSSTSPRPAHGRRPTSPRPARSGRTSGGGSGSNKLAMVGLVFIVLLVLVGDLRPAHRAVRPITERVAGALPRRRRRAEHWFGTDTHRPRRVQPGGLRRPGVAADRHHRHRDRRWSSALFLGAVAGFFGGVTDTLIMRITDIFLAIPYIVLAVAIASVLGRSENTVILVLGLTGWLGITPHRALELPVAQAARVRRGGRTRSGYSRGRDHVPAHPAERAAADHRVRHDRRRQRDPRRGGAVVPRRRARRTRPRRGASWCPRARATSPNAPHLLFFPGMAIFLTVLAFVFVGDGLRDALDPKLK